MAGSLRIHAVAVLLVSAAALCVGVAASGATQRARVVVTPASSVEDQPVRITATGLPARLRVTVDVRSTDGKGVAWRSSTVFRSDAHGRLDLDHAAAVSGSYFTGATYRPVWGMGAIATMQPTKAAPADAYFWTGVRRFTVTISAHGRVLAATAFRRRLAADSPRPEQTTIAADGFVGTYWAPSSPGKRPAVVAFGGSEGGESTYLLGALLAAHGYPTLALAYFNGPGFSGVGLPRTLRRIPLEYFAKAITWLQNRPQVDANHVLTLGISRGSEAALLLGVHYPSLVHGVIASVPANVSLCSVDCDGPAWTLHGRPLPYTRQFDTPSPTDHPAAIIPVERIHGPVFLDCGGSDRTWISCPYAEAIVRRLDDHHVTYTHQLERFPGAGHFVGSFLPYWPTSAIPPDPNDEQAREKLWPQLLSFLSHA